MKCFLFILLQTCIVNAQNLEYLDPTKLQTVVDPNVQRDVAFLVILANGVNENQVVVEIDPNLFKDHKDTFHIQTIAGKLHIKASTGVAAIWGYNYFLKKYCKSQIAWQDISRIAIPDPLPIVNETVTANDRFRYYQNVCTASYSFVWWNYEDWHKHLMWMALNGINLALAPIAQEALWIEVYKEIGMTNEEMDEHFTGPGFLAWQRMGNLRGWGGPLTQSWHTQQKEIQSKVVDAMYQLGIVPVLPAFNGHVPKAFARIFPNATFLSVDTWNDFESENCCGLFLDPDDPLFKTIGEKFLTKVIRSVRSPSHIYSVDPFNEVKINPWSLGLIKSTSQAIFSTLLKVDDKAVWLVQNWMFVHDPILWPLSNVESFLTSVPIGRMLVLDLQSEQWPQYELYKMYYGQPFIWCMLHNFGGTLGMFGSMPIINARVHSARSLQNSTMIGIGLTPEGINQNYVVYDLMLETAWRTEPVDLEAWVAEYAERRYGCTNLTTAWKYLLKSVYSYDGLNKIRGKYVITRRPSFSIKPWAWYKSKDLFQAFKHFALYSGNECRTSGFAFDLVDVTRQALQYRAEQLYVNLVKNRMSTTWVFKDSVTRYLDAMKDIQSILNTCHLFRAQQWFDKAAEFAERNPQEISLYTLNARNQVTLWGPKGEISDYAGKQWAEMFQYYYIPRWNKFLDAAVDAKIRNEVFDEKRAQMAVRTVEEAFAFQNIPHTLAEENRLFERCLHMFNKWAYVSGLEDLPLSFVKNKKING